MNKYTIRTYTDVPEKLISDWKKIWNASEFATITNSPAWLLAAMKAFDYKDVKIITIYSASGKLEAVAPFVKTKIFGLSVYTTPAPEFADRPALLIDYEDKRMTRFLFSEITKLNTVYITCFTPDLLDRIPLNNNAYKAFPAEQNPYIDMSDGPYGMLSKRKRKVVLNRLESSGQDYSFEPAAANLPAAMDKAFTIDTISAKNAKGKGIFHRKEARELYSQLARFCPSDTIISLLSFDKKPAAYIIGFLHKKTHYSSQKAYIDGYDYFNPGRLSLICLIDHFREKGITEFDLGRGNDRFKQNFTGKVRQLHDVIISKNKVIRFYITTMYRLHTTLYNQISRHPILYKTYKLIR